MSTVSRNEWLKQSMHEDDRDRMDEQFDEHATEGVKQRRPAQQGRPGRYPRRRGDTGHGRGTDVPQYPAPLPGAQPHIDHPEVVDQGKPKPLDVGPAKPYYSGMMAHGVDAPVVHGGRPAPKDEDRAELAANRLPEPWEPPAKEHPVPVYLVDTGAGNRPLRRMALRQVTIPASAAAPFQIEPVLVAGRDIARLRVRLLNEDQTNGIRIGVGPTTEQGVLLPAKMTSYEDFETQDDIWALGDTTSACLLSVIIEYSVANGA